SWSKVNGPGNVAFSNGNHAAASADFSSTGVYILRLTVTDGDLSASDDVSVTVTGDDIATWRARHFTAAELADPTISGDNADPDADGLTNGQEFICGTDPRDAASYLKLDSTGMNGTGGHLHFQAAAGRTYTVQYRDNPASGAWVKLQDIPAQSSPGVVEV